MTTTPLSRRGFLGAGAATSLGVLFAGSLDALAGPVAHAATRPSDGYGPLVDDPAGLLALPAGFSYQLVSTAGTTTLSGGGLSPADPDGAGLFTTPAGYALVLNHEISGSEQPGVPVTPGRTFDPGANGGTTTIDVDRTGRRLSEHVSLAGTVNNCAGGVTPWGTWLTCEETEARKGGKLLQDHGWVFEVEPTGDNARAAVPLTFLGRYAHEATAIDPSTGVVYLTEDAGGPLGLYFRWLPPAGFRGGQGAFHALAQSPGGDTAGRLQAMVCSRGGRHVSDLSQATNLGTQYRVSWVDVPDRLAATTSVRKQFRDDQVTRSRKLEGQWYADGTIKVVASFARLSDGSVNEHDGQIWSYDPAKETLTLETLFGVNPDPSVDAENYDGPDNITVSPFGGVVMAEDGGGVQHLVGVTAQGKAYPIARNQLNDSEFAGPVFSPDGQVLFASIQSPGHTFAITGPWGRPSNSR